MPRLVLPLADEYQSILRRISVQCMKKVREYLDLPPETTYYYKGTANQLMTFNSALGRFDRIDVNDGTRFGHGDTLMIEVKDEETDDGFQRVNMRDPNIPPIWYDENHQMYIHPNHVASKLTLSCTYKSENMERANWLRSTLLRLCGMDRQVMKLGVEYYIHPDKFTYEVIKHVYTLQEKNEGYGIPFEEYLKGHADQNSLRKLTKLDGGGSVFGFKERQVQLVAYFDLTAPPEKDKRDNNPGYEIQFDFILYYEKPVSVTFGYPIVVHNQLIDQKYITAPAHDTRHHLPHVRYSILQEGLNSVIEQYYGLRWSYTDHHGITVPLGDDWQPRHPIRNFSPVFTSLCCLQQPDEQGWYQIIDMETILKYINFGTGTLRYMGDHYADLTSRARTPILFSLYKDDVLIDPIYLKMDDELNLYCRFKFSQRDRVHLQISMIHDFNLTDINLFYKMRQYPDMVGELYRTYIEEDRISAEALLEQCKREGVDQIKAFQRMKTWLRSGVEYQREGYWLKIKEAMMFDGELPDNFDIPLSYIYNYFYSWLPEGKTYWETLRGNQFIDTRNHILNQFRYHLYYWLLEKYVPNEQDRDFDEQFFGRIDLRHFMIKLRRQDAQMDGKCFIPHGMFTQQATYVNVKRLTYHE